MSWVVWMVLALVQGALTEQVRNLPSTNVNQTDGRKTADIHGALMDMLLFINLWVVFPIIGVFKCNQFNDNVTKADQCLV